MRASGLITFLPYKHWSFGYVAGFPKLLGMKALEQETRRATAEGEGLKTSVSNSPGTHRPSESREPRAEYRVLIHFLRSGDPLINRLSAREPFLGSVPVRDRFLPQLPAEQHNLTLDHTGKIEQSNVEIFHLHAN